MSCCLIVQGQNTSKVAISIEKAYRKSAEKCINKAKKYVSNRTETEVDYYYMSLS